MRLFGHPVHPMLVHVPLALWIVGTACDALTLLGVAGAWPLAWLAILVGLAAALPAMVAGLADFARVPEPAGATATRHMLLMALAWSAYLAALLMRSDGLAVQPAPARGAMAVSLVAFLLLVAGAAHGGQLVYRLGVGVDSGAGNPR
ncbi:MAG TPA: DUF2231 domain-containing protein [Croceibacterium sp.]|nr:DUF2231 domain-containing protein [Croceibacterium sp.]